MHDHTNVKLYRESFFSSPDLSADLTKQKLLWDHLANRKGRPHDIRNKKMN
jgi:hypothetical protein